MIERPAQTKRRVDPGAYPNSLRQVLAVLCNSLYTTPNYGLTAAEVSRILRNEFGIRLHWRTVDTLLARRRDFVDRRKSQGRWRYSLLAGGKDYLGAPDSSILLIDPADAVQAVASLHAFFSSLTGLISICDPYFDDVTLEHLDSCSVGSPVRVLTEKVKDSGKVRRLLAASHVSGHAIKIRVASTPALHDRYVIDGQSMLILGTSLNGFGKKQCFVIRAGADIRNVMLREFEAAWGTATPWP